MPVSKHKPTTSQASLSTSEPSAHPLPEQQEFHQHLRTLAQRAVRTVIELVMREELDAFIGAAWGESSPRRKGYRTGIGSAMVVSPLTRVCQVMPLEYDTTGLTPASLQVKGA